MTVASFLASVPESVRAAYAGLPDLDRRLEAIAEDAATVGVDRASIESAIARRIGDADADPAATLAAFRPHDLAVAVGCAAGGSLALVAFERDHGREIDRAIEKSPSLGIATDEFRQIVRTKLLVAEPGEAPKILAYGGRAPLSAWVRVTCARTVIDLARRKDDREVLGGSSLLEAWPDTADPELTAMRSRYAPLLPKAFAAALAKLSPRQRNLLRQRFLRDIPAQTLAASYGVHRGTVFAWLDDARRDLLSHVRVALGADVGPASLDSVVEVMGSALDVSVRRLLDSNIEPEP
jgi:RNA polymerase sigma-70 factor (ECF subfamily)